MATTTPTRRGTTLWRGSARRLGPGGRQVALFAFAYLVYFGVRALTEGSARTAAGNALELISLERALGIDWEGALQEAAMGSRLLMDAANAVYVYGHWPVIVVAGVLLFRYRRPQYVRLRDACLISGLVGLVIFSLYPVAPPRLTDLPLIDTVTRDDPGYRQIVPAAMVNEYAAMPSFHAGWNLLVGIVVFGATGHWLLRALAVLGPAAMMVAVVVTANHFVVDVVAGVAIVLLALLARDALHRRRVRIAGRARCRVADQQRGLGPRSVPDRASRRERPHSAAARTRSRRPAG